MTTPGLWPRVRALLDAALAQPPDRRAAWVRGAAAGDAELAGEVLSLLAHHREEDGFLESEPPTFADDRQVGAYRLLGEVGSGGMGVVWEAERSDDLFTKRVAIKFVKRGMDSEEVLRRFRRERQILAQLEHPNIARLLDAGVAADGRPWFAMEFVEGEPLTLYCRTRNLPERTRLALFREVCQAVHFAHRNLVVHRDLKPSNILVTSEGAVKLLDFGVARLLEGGAGEGDEVTRVGTRPMTPAYASPEQSQGQPVTTASDIYTLGVVLHELLTGTRPGEPRVPISPEDPGGSPPLSAELAAIVGMAVRPEPERRYASVAELDDDVARYLAGFPVRARPDTAAYRFGSFVRRNRMGVAGAALVGMALVAGGSVAAWQARVAVQERARAEARAAELRQLSTGLLFEVHDAISTLPGATATRELVVRLAFDHLARLAGEDAGDPALERDVARGYLRLASVLANPVGAGLGDREGARAALEQAVEIAERTSGLRGEGRGTTGEVADDALALRAEALRRWGDFLAWEGEVEAGVEALAHSLDAYQRLAALRGPSDATAHLEVVIAHLKIGDHTGHPVFRNLGDPQGALEHYGTAIAALDRPPLAGSEAWNVRRFRGLLDERVGAIHRALGDAEAALEPLRRSLAVRLELAGEAPNHLDALRDVAIGHQLVCEVEVERGRPGRALPDCRAALARFEALRDLDPENRGAHVDLAIMQGATARVLAAAGDRVEARRVAAEAIRTREEILVRDPGNTVNPGILDELRAWFLTLNGAG